MRRRTILLAAVLASGAAVQGLAAELQQVDVTGAWDVTITKPGGSISGLAILSQDGVTVTGMIGPALTDMMPVEGTVEGATLTLRPRPRAGRTAAFATCALSGTHDRMSGTIDTDQGTIEITRRQRAETR